ncbi:MAG: hypothetical protein M3Q23_16000 [Actinomycetota bacterium]|nr:hypothetical protein [Actinomycetota bacterium]
MALWALVPGVPAAVLAFAIGSFVGLGVGVSAAIGVVAAVGGFVGQALALGWARNVSLTATQVVAYAGFLVLLGVVVGVYAGLNATASWFSPKAFGGGLFALIPVAFYEAYLARRGRIAELIVDADRAAGARPKGAA